MSDEREEFYPKKVKEYAEKISEAYKYSNGGVDVALTPQEITKILMDVEVVFRKET